MPAINVGDQAPDFVLRDGDGKEWRLSDFKGSRTVVLLFYPGDNTPVCTKQLCSVRNRWQEYLETGAEVVGVSTDSTDSHKNFRDQYNLPLRLLADTGAKVSKIYGVKSWIPGKSARAVFVIDKDGTIKYRKVEALSIFRPKDDEIIAAVRALAPPSGR
ncbi:MAG: peroxiredoxin [Pyrinomonadaceae bacterium]